MKKTSGWHEAAREDWNGRAASWSKKSKELWEKGSRKDILSFFIKNVTKDRSILDVGCGNGYGSFKLRQSGYHVEGVDLSEEMIKNARKQDELKAIIFKQGDVCDLPYEDSSFEGLIAINVLEWTEVPLMGLLEMKRVLKHDGLLCIGILGPTAGPRNSSYPRFYGEKAICNTMMPWEFERLAMENGFENIDGFGVYKEGVQDCQLDSLSVELKQANTFMWVFMLRKVGE